MTMTVVELRTHITSSLVDAALQKLLDAAYQAIANRVGGAGAVTEFDDGGYSTLVLDRQASAITSVTETVGGVATVLAANDYRAGSYVLTRLDTGTNPRTLWGATQTVYTPAVDVAEQDRVAIALVKLDLNNNPGLQAERIGDWEESYVDNSAMNYAVERELILSSLDTAAMMTIVGG